MKTIKLSTLTASTIVMLFSINTYSQCSGMGKGIQNSPTFETFDLNGDGQITTSEFKKIRTQRQNTNNSSMKCNKANAPSFKSIDLDNNGKISKEEFVIHQTNRFNKKSNMQKQGNRIQNRPTKDKTIVQFNIKNSKGYKLMENKCFICHFKKPDPEKKNQMIAPPMLRIKEHYYPNHQNKEDFIKAIVEFANNPSEKNTLMPGAVKKFKLMPKLIYKTEELNLIAETIYKYDFGSAPKIRMKTLGELQLNNGKRWKLKKITTTKVDELINKLHTFKSNNTKDYNQFGKYLFEQAKLMMLDKSYTGKKFNQIHNFFNNIEGDMHSLMTEQSINNAQKIIQELKIKFNRFYEFFEIY